MERRERMVVRSMVRVEGGEGADILGGWDDRFWDEAADGESHCWPAEHPGMVDASGGWYRH